MRCIICKQDIKPTDNFAMWKWWPYHKVCLFDVLSTDSKILKKLKD